MNLAVIRRECSFDIGGAEAYCANICNRFSSLGHKVTLVADRAEIDSACLLRAMVMGRGSIMKNLSFFVNSRRILKVGGFDLTYGLSRVAPVDVLRISDPLHAAWLDLGYPWTGRLRRFMPRHKMLLWMERMAIEEARAIIVNSNMVKAQIEHYYDMALDKVHVVYNGVDTSLFAPMLPDEREMVRLSMGLPADITVFLFAGTDLRRKGLAPLIHGLDSLSSCCDFALLIAGVCSDRAMEAEIRRLGLSKRVRWLGYTRDMARLYGISDLFILPTLYDPFANAVLEAMACGTPALTTVNNGASEVAREVDEWLVIKNSTADAIHGALRRFVGLSGDMRSFLRGKAVSVAAKYSWEAHMASLQTVFLTKGVNLA
ncbi:MAG: glycosyltransferase family 4 protein [Dissulfurimicrobium sp.]|uniref:glycosyltransferase family 4 protein n=1 Tax=Dissulfurimicrobium sp. TaxID=2022436 RepID=UPI003D0E8B2D